MKPTEPVCVALLAARCDSAAVREISNEHGALSRQIAGLQRHVGEQLRAYARQVGALDDEVLRLRAQLLITRTSILWGLGLGLGLASRPARVKRLVDSFMRPTAAASSRAQPSASPSPALNEASAVICQTGCVGHAHPWREIDGQCRRTGQACEQNAWVENHNDG